MPPRKYLAMSRDIFGATTPVGWDRIERLQLASTGERPGCCYTSYTAQDRTAPARHTPKDDLVQNFSSAEVEKFCCKA